MRMRTRSVCCLILPCLQDRFGFEWNQRGQHPTVEAWAEAVRDDWSKFMHKVGQGRALANFKPLFPDPCPHSLSILLPTLLSPLL